VPKKAQFTHERVEHNVSLFDEPLKGSKSLKIFNSLSGGGSRDVPPFLTLFRGGGPQSIPPFYVIPASVFAV
jgi:hypothetical protein